MKTKAVDLILPRKRWIILFRYHFTVIWHKDFLGKSPFPLSLPKCRERPLIFTIYWIFFSVRQRWHCMTCKIVERKWNPIRITSVRSRAIRLYGETISIKWHVFEANVEQSGLMKYSSSSLVEVGLNLVRCAFSIRIECGSGSAFWCFLSRDTHLKRPIEMHFQE